MTKRIDENCRNKPVASAVNDLVRQQGRTERSARRLGPDKKVGGLGAAGQYDVECEGRYQADPWADNPTKGEEPPYSDDGPSRYSDYNPW
jgi:hypothetical protein